MLKHKAFIILALLFCFFHARADNPLISGIGMSDPHVRVFNDTVYLYTGHDTSPNDKTWVMKEWRIFRSTDLVNWEQVGTISPEDNYMDDQSTDCWAADAIKRNGQYYFYFSDRKRGVGVMTAPQPQGPFADPLGKPLVSPMHDPTILVDDDSAHYLVYGDKEGGGFHIARLNDDMISLAEAPKPIEITGEEWEQAPQWMDKNYIFNYKNTYYLSWGRDYAVSKNVYGPYTSVGAVGEGYDLNEYAHGSFFHWKGQFYHLWCRYLRPGYKYRETIMTYCHIDDEDRIVTDTGFLDKHYENGVGQYHAGWERLEAEWFYEISEGLKKSGTREDGFKVEGITNGSWLRFANTTFQQAKDRIVISVPELSGKAFMEIRLGSPDGQLLGSVDLHDQKSDGLYAGTLTQSFEGTADLYLVFNGKKSFQCSLDWLRFN
jgi:hypothetical protein